MILNSKGEDSGKLQQREMLISMVVQQMIIEFRTRLMDLTIRDFVQRLGNENVEKILQMTLKIDKEKYKNLTDESKLTQIGQILSQVKNEDERKQMFGNASSEFEKLIRELFMNKEEDIQK